MMGVDNTLAIKISPPLVSVCLEKGINTPKRVAALLGQLMVESDNFETTEESLWFRTTTTMSKSFGDRMTSRIDLVRQPEKLANFVYADRLGNGDEASGDGWRYRGSGWIQTTGKTNFAKVKDATGVDVVKHPDLLREDLVTMTMAAVLHFVNTNCIAFADAGQLENITRAFNGRKMFKAPARAAWAKKAQEFLTSNWVA